MLIGSVGPIAPFGLGGTGSSNAPQVPIGPSLPLEQGVIVIIGGFGILIAVLLVVDALRGRIGRRDTNHSGDDDGRSALPASLESDRRRLGSPLRYPPLDSLLHAIDPLGDVMGRGGPMSPNDGRTAFRSEAAPAWVRRLAALEPDADATSDDEASSDEASSDEASSDEASADEASADEAGVRRSG